MGIVCSRSPMPKVASSPSYVACARTRVQIVHPREVAEVHNRVALLCTCYRVQRSTRHSVITEGRDLVADFTGPQFDTEARLAATDTPYWCAHASAVDDGARVDPHFGLSFRERAVGFGGPLLPLGIFDEQGSMLSTLAVRDAIIGRFRLEGR